MLERERRRSVTMGNACLRGSEIHHHQEEKDEEELQQMGSSVSRLVLLRKKKLQQQLQQQRQQSRSLSFSSPAPSSFSYRAAPSPPPPPPPSSSSSSPSSQSLLVPVEMKPAMEILPRSHEGVVRLKLIISTNQMASMINASYKKDDFLESLITSLLKEKGITIPDKPNLVSSTSLEKSSLAWKPALESIPEMRSS